MKKKYYHATDPKNLGKILNEGIHVGCDGVVYLTENPQEACKFLFVRGFYNIIVFEVFLDEALVEETFDHNESFFKCRAYGYSKDILPSEIEGATQYNYSLSG